VLEFFTFEFLSRPEPWFAAGAQGEAVSGVELTFAGARRRSALTRQCSQSDADPFTYTACDVMACDRAAYRAPVGECDVYDALDEIFVRFRVMHHAHIMRR
jgi:hypothetical protein